MSGAAGELGGAPLGSSGPGAFARLPAMATTGVGSLPFADVTVAARHVTRAYELPFCPQLPRHDGDMVAEWLGPDWAGGTRCGWTAERDRERPAAWDATLAALADRPPAHRLVKLQTTGPVTLAVALERGAGRPPTASAVATLAREVGMWLAANVAAQVERLGDQGLDALVVVDEPGLAHGWVDDAVDVWDPLARCGGAWGLHVCGAVPWRTVRRAAPDLLSFDLVRRPVDPEAAAAIAALVAGGSRVAWGAVDPVRPDRPADVGARVAAAVAAVAGRGVPANLVVARSLMTPSCGTGRLSPGRERLVASVLAAGRAARRGSGAGFDPAVPSRPGTGAGRPATGPRTLGG